MNTIRDLLRDADPFRHEPHRLAEERDRLRHAVVAAASDVTASSFTTFRAPIALLAAVTLIIIAIVAVASQVWSHGAANLPAAVRFEVRLAEGSPSAGLRETRISGSDRVVYVHQEIILTNSDIAQSQIIQGDGPLGFGISVEFNAAGTQKMRRATVNHIDKPIALLIDGDVVAAPVLRAPISTSATISGDFTRAEAERIVNGMGVR